MAIVGGIILIIFYVGMVGIAEFIAPYDLEHASNFTDASPQAIHFIDKQGKFHFQPLTYGLVKKIDEVKRVRTFVEDPNSNQYPIYLFVKGDPYKLFGLIPMSLHLFGIKIDGSRGNDIYHGHQLAGTGLFLAHHLRWAPIPVDRFDRPVPHHHPG